MNSTAILTSDSGFYETSGLGSDKVQYAYVRNCEDLTAAMKHLQVGLAVEHGQNGIAE